MTFLKESGIPLAKLTEAPGFKNRSSLNQRFADPSKWTFEEVKRVMAIIERVNKAYTYPMPDDFERLR